MKSRLCDLTPEGCFSRTETTGGFTATNISKGVPKDGGTEVTIELNYTLPGSILGLIANKLGFEKKQEESLEHTLEKLKTLLEAE